MVRFRGKSCLGPPGPGEGGSRGRRSWRAPPQAGVGAKTRSAGGGPIISLPGLRGRTGVGPTTARSPHMEFTFKGRGVHITGEIRDVAAHKLSRFARMEPR